MVNRKKPTQLFDDESTKPRGNFSYLVNAFNMKIKEGKKEEGNEEKNETGSKKEEKIEKSRK